MLTIQRYVDESVIVLCEGKTIEVKVTRVRGKEINLSFGANEEVGIYRKELLDRARDSQD